VPGKNFVRVEGEVIEVLPKTLFWVQLKNGHRILAHVPRRYRGTFQAAEGEKVILAVSPYDLSTGMIVVEEKDL
jgi:translation initiation factor IF-1